MKAYLITYDNEDTISYQITKDKELADAIEKTFLIKKENGTYIYVSVDEIELKD